MMQQLRAKTKWIMLVTAAAFVGLMVFEWGMDLSGRSSMQLQGGEIGRVNGEAITYEEFSLVYQNLYEQYRLQIDGPITSLVDRDIEEAAWRQLVSEKLILQELRRHGIEATAAEVRQAARYMPPAEIYYSELFQTDGQFDLSKYHAYLSSPSVDPQFLVALENYYRQELPRQKLLRRVTAASFVTDAELWRIWRDTNERMSVRYVRIVPEDAAAESLTVSDAEIEAFYRANRERFRRPATAVARMISLSRAPTAADTAATLERARALAAEIRGGADFAEVARRESRDPGTATAGGDLGTFGRGVMTAAFDSAVFALPVGQVSEPVLTEFGYHIIEVTGRDGDQVTARHILLTIEPDDASLDALLMRADSLEIVAEREGFDAAAQRFGLQPTQVEISEALPFAPEVGRLDEGLDWAKWEARPGDVSPVFETPSAFYLLELVELRPEGVAPLAEVRALIDAELRRRQLLDRARGVAEAIVNEARTQSSLAAAAEKRGLEVLEATDFRRVDFVPGLGQANAAVGAAFGLQPGQVSNVIESDGALYVIEATDRQPADREAWEAQKALQRLQVMSQLENDRWQAYLAALWESAEIVDNRHQVLRGPVDDEDATTPRGRVLF